MRLQQLSSQATVNVNWRGQYPQRMARRYAHQSAIPHSPLIHNLQTQNAKHAASSDDSDEDESSVGKSDADDEPSDSDDNELMGRKLNEKSLMKHLNSEVCYMRNC